MDENQSALLDPSSLQDDLLWDSSTQIPEQTKMLSWSPVLHLVPFISGSHTLQSHGYCCPQPSHPWPVFPSLQVQGSAEYVPSSAYWSSYQEVVINALQKPRGLLVPWSVVLPAFIGMFGWTPTRIWATRLLPNIWRRLCLIPQSLQQTSTTPPHVLVCLLSLLCKLSAESHLSQSRAPTIPTCNYGVAFLKTLYPATAVLQQWQLSHHICADQELICLAPTSVRDSQPQICRAAPSSVACSGLWHLLSQGVRGNFSAECWGPPLAARCHCCWA